MNIQRHRLALNAILAGTLLLAPPADAQARYHVTRTPAELLAGYVREYEREYENDTLRRTGASRGDIAHILTYHTDYPPADVESLLQGLERLARTGNPPRLRAEAALYLALPGTRRAARPMPGIFARLERLYRRSSDPLVRTVIIGALGGLATDRREAVAFLECKAAQPREDVAGSAGKALTSLLLLGPEGREALRRLHATRAVHEPEAHRILERMASYEFRLPE